MRKRFLANTFSPMMLGEGTKAVIFRDIPDWLIRRSIKEDIIVSIVSHETTAKILSALFHKDIEFNRANVQLQPGDKLLCIIPNFRASEAREFTPEMVHVESEEYGLEGY